MDNAHLHWLENVAQDQADTGLAIVLELREFIHELVTEVRRLQSAPPVCPSCQDSFDDPSMAALGPVEDD